MVPGAGVPPPPTSRRRNSPSAARSPMPTRARSPHPAGIATRRAVRHCATAPYRLVTRSAATSESTSGNTRPRTVPSSRRIGKGNAGTGSHRASCGITTIISVCSHASWACCAANDRTYAIASGSLGKRKSSARQRRPRNRAVLNDPPRSSSNTNGGTVVIARSAVLSMHSLLCRTVALNGRAKRVVTVGGRAARGAIRAARTRHESLASRRCRARCTRAPPLVGGRWAATPRHR